jgi:hypothetical protein
MSKTMHFRWFAHQQGSEMSVLLMIRQKINGAAQKNKRGEAHRFSS